MQRRETDLIEQVEVPGPYLDTTVVPEVVRHTEAILQGAAAIEVALLTEPVQVEELIEVAVHLEVHLDTEVQVAVDHLEVLDTQGLLRPQEVLDIEALVEAPEVLAGALEVPVVLPVPLEVAEVAVEAEEEDSSKPNHSTTS